MKHPYDPRNSLWNDPFIKLVLFGFPAIVLIVILIHFLLLQY